MDMSSGIPRDFILTPKNDCFGNIELKSQEDNNMEQFKTFKEPIKNKFNALAIN